jgi:hypothetical protein
MGFLAPLVGQALALVGTRDNTNNRPLELFDDHDQAVDRFFEPHRPGLEATSHHALIPIFPSFEIDLRNLTLISLPS